MQASIGQCVCYTNRWMLSQEISQPLHSLADVEIKRFARRTTGTAHSIFFVSFCHIWYNSSAENCGVSLPSASAEAAAVCSCRWWRFDTTRVRPFVLSAICWCSFSDGFRYQRAGGGDSFGERRTRLRFSYNGTDFVNPFITVKRADEPMEVLWTSLDVNSWSSIARLLASWTLAVGIVFGCFMISYTASVGNLHGFARLLLPSLALALNEFGPMMCVFGHIRACTYTSIGVILCAFVSLC